MKIRFDEESGAGYSPLLFSRLGDHFIRVICHENHVLLVETSLQRLFGREKLQYGNINREKYSRRLTVQVNTTTN